MAMQPKRYRAADRAEIRRNERANEERRNMHTARAFDNGAVPAQPDTTGNAKALQQAVDRLVDNGALRTSYRKGGKPMPKKRKKGK